jgi:hypothetical protein
MPQTGSGSERLDRDCIAEIGQTFDQALFLPIGGTSIEVIAAEVLVHRAVFEHVVDRSKDGGRDGHDRLFGATTGFDAVELGPQITVFLFTAAQAHCTSVVLSQASPLRMRLDRRLPALSSLRGHMQAHERRCSAEGNRLTSIPTSETMT